MILMIFLGRLVEIDPAKFEAKRPNAYKTLGKSMILMIFGGRLVEIDPAKFEAKRPRAGPL